MAATFSRRSTVSRTAENRSSPQSADTRSAAAASWRWRATFILAADTAVFGQPEITLGIMPGNGGTQRLTRSVGKAKAMELCLTGRHIKAEEAERSNLVSRVVPAAELMDEAMKVADKIANLSQHAVMMIKEAINRGFATTLAEGARFERGQFYSLFATEDQKEGMTAFIEKRTPVFTNR